LSGLAYADEIISEEVLTNLIELGTKSSTGSGLESWDLQLLKIKMK